MKTIKLSHGAGGREMGKLLREFVINSFKNYRASVPLQALDDAAVIEDIVFTTDGHTVQPLFFPNSDIGRLAIAGTINDIVVMGAKPLALSAALIIEEGFSIENFRKIISSMAFTAEEAETEIVTGDTKVVEKGGLKDMVITTAAIGKRHPLLDHNLKIAQRMTKWLLDSSLRHGDILIINGTIADHGIAVMSKREDYGFSSTIISDVAPLDGLMNEVLKVGGIVSAKDATRGGIANSLNEMAEKSGIGMQIYEDAIPLNDNTRAACEMLGLDPFTIGNEGKIIFGVTKDTADEVLKAMKCHQYGKKAAIIGEVVKGHRVTMETSVGGTRIIDMPQGDPIPRIC